MDKTAVFKLSYGLFFLGSEWEGKKSICVVNTVEQLTQTPLRVGVTMLKTGYTHSLVEKSGKFSAGIMSREATMEDIAHFGQSSGRDTDKLAGFDVQTDQLGSPLYQKGCNAAFCCRVVDSVDLGTHTLFIADLIDAKTLSDKPSLTYSDYSILKSGGTLSGGEEKKPKDIWQCSICHYVYDGDIPFEELPDDWLCPVCKKPKSVFTKI